MHDVLEFGMACHVAYHQLGSGLTSPLANSSKIGNHDCMTSGHDNTETPHEVQESLIRILLFDVMTAQERLTAKTSQSNMRDLIRCAFAAIDGLLWTYSEHVASVAKEMDAISAAETMALAQSSYQVTANGEVRPQPRFVPLLTTIRLATRIAQRIAPDFDVSFETDDWVKLQDAIHVRNRITHPKKRSDLHINEKEVALCLSGLFWVLELGERAMASTNSAFAAHTAGLWKVFQDLERGDAETWRQYREALASDDE
ncbi:MAG: hypothetical protein PHE36_08455 [Novosphingobium sp.]|nr:hypothetical protein [Novosphingobium sp.]